MTFLFPPLKFRISRRRHGSQEVNRCELWRKRMGLGPAGTCRGQRPPSALDTLPPQSHVDRQAQTTVLRPRGREDEELDSCSPLTDAGLWLSRWSPPPFPTVGVRPGPGTLGRTSKCPLMGGAPASRRSR